jgi:hypothetical protein
MAKQIFQIIATITIPVYVSFLFSCIYSFLPLTSAISSISIIIFYVDSPGSSQYGGGGSIAKSFYYLKGHLTTFSVSSFSIEQLLKAVTPRPRKDL